MSKHQSGSGSTDMHRVLYILQTENKRKMEKLKKKEEEQAHLRSMLDMMNKKLESAAQSEARMSSVGESGDRKAAEFKVAINKWKEYGVSSEKEIWEYKDQLEKIKLTKTVLVVNPAWDKVMMLRDAVRAIIQSHSLGVVKKELKPLQQSSLAIHANRQESVGDLDGLCGRLEEVTLETGLVKERAPVRRKTRTLLLSNAMAARKELMQEVVKQKMDKRALEVKARMRNSRSA